MTQRVVIFVIALALAAPVAVRAQTAKHPDFSGAWKVTSIDMPEAAGGGAPGRDRGGFGGGGGFGGRGGFGRRGGFGGGGRTQRNDGADANGTRPERPQRLEVGQTIHIRQTDDQLIVTQGDGQGTSTMSSYTLDGKESTNKAGQMTTKSKSRWEGVALVTDMTRSMDTQRGNVDIKSREVRSLSEDGKTMTVRTTMNTPRGNQTMTVSYEKATS